MGLIPQTKCSRCDRMYSAWRSRCPYCGARHRKNAKRVADTDNSVWKLIIGILLLVVLIAAVVVLLVTSLSGESDTDSPDNDKNIVSDEGVNSLVDPNDKTNHGNTADPGTQGGNATDPGTQGGNTTDPGTQGSSTTGGETTSQPGEQVKPAVNSVAITYGGSRLAYDPNTNTYEFTMKLKESLTLNPKIDPSNCDITPVWEISDDSVAVILQSGKVTAIGKGTAIIKVTVGDISDECLVRVIG